MTLKEAREVLGLGLTATKKEIRQAFRRQARQWHPDLAPPERAKEFAQHMRQVNAAYRRLTDFVDNYRYRLEEDPEVEEWWRRRFSTGVTQPPRRGEDSDQ